MAENAIPPYTLTVRQAEGDGSRFEYVVSRPGHEAIRSRTSYPTYEAAKAAGDALGHTFSRRAAPSTADD